MAAINFERQVMLPDGTMQPFPIAALDLITRIKQKAYQEQQLDAQTIAQWEQRQMQTRAAMGPDVPRAAPRFGQVGRHARPQGLSRQDARRHLGDGPFLHNGSVPTIYDLLKPAAERPVTFPTGRASTIRSSSGSRPIARSTRSHRVCPDS